MNTVEQGQAKMVVVFAMGLAVGLFVGYYIAGVWGAPPPDIVTTIPAENASEGEVLAHKDALLRRTALSTSLSDIERQVMVRAALEGAERYRFTEEETAALNRALQR